MESSFVIVIGMDFSFLTTEFGLQEFFSVCFWGKALPQLVPTSSDVATLGFRLYYRQAAWLLLFIATACMLLTAAESVASVGSNIFRRCNRLLALNYNREHRTFNFFGPTYRVCLDGERRVAPGRWATRILGFGLVGGAAIAAA